jgi:hypothetical protein
MADLSPFEGRDVITTRIAITNAGDGLSEALAVEPNEMHLGETVYVVLECEVAKIRHDPVKDTDGLARVHTLKAGTGTIVDAGLVQDVIADQARRNQLAREQAEGVQRLDLDDDEGDYDPADETIEARAGAVAREIADNAKATRRGARAAE